MRMNDGREFEPEALEPDPSRIHPEIIDLTIQLPETAEPRGLKAIEAAAGGQPQELAAGTALALALLLDQTPEAMATGRDVTILEVRSQELLIDLLETLAGTEKAAGYAVLMNYLCDRMGTSNQKMSELMINIAEQIKNYFNKYKERTYDQRVNAYLEIKLSLEILSKHSKEYLDDFMYQTPMIHEGGAANLCFESNLYRDLCLNYGIAATDDTEEGGSSKTGLSVHTAHRLAKEREHLLTKELELA